MLTFLLVVYVIIAIITATLSLAQLVDNNQGYWGCDSDGFDIFVFSLCSILMGIVWPVTIWVAIVLNYVNKKTYVWIVMLRDAVNLIKKGVKKCQK